MSFLAHHPFAAADHMSDNKHHLLLACTGSVATIKLPNIVDALTRHPNLSIRIILSSSARHFLLGQSHEQPSLEEIRLMPNVDGIYFDEDEYREPWVRGAAILHIELRRWADLLVIAPLSANSLAKMAGGLCDNLVMSVVRAWDATGELDAPRAVDGVVTRKKILVAPAMNTAMHAHPLTQRHLDVLAEWSVHRGGWVDVLPAVQKGLACGDTGNGAMHDWNAIVRRIEQEFELPGR